MLVTTIICPLCKSQVYSRDRHDCNPCTCGACFIDGGRDYNRTGYKEESKPEVVQVEIPYTQEQLFEDWNHRAHLPK